MIEGARSHIEQKERNIADLVADCRRLPPANEEQLRELERLRTGRR